MLIGGATVIAALDAHGVVTKDGSEERKEKTEELRDNRDVGCMNKCVSS